MQLRAATQTKLEHTKQALAKEFVSVPWDEIAKGVDAVAIGLLERARFDDYIPILAHRFAREILHRRIDAQTLSEAA